jgi:hypothetical protein
MKFTELSLKINDSLMIFKEIPIDESSQLNINDH